MLNKGVYDKCVSPGSLSPNPLILSSTHHISPGLGITDPGMKDLQAAQNKSCDPSCSPEEGCSWRAMGCRGEGAPDLGFMTCGCEGGRAGLGQLACSSQQPSLPFHARSWLSYWTWPLPPTAGFPDGVPSAQLIIKGCSWEVRNLWPLGCLSSSSLGPVQG